MKRVLLTLTVVLILGGLAVAAWFLFLRPPSLGLPVAFVRDVWGEVDAGLGEEWAPMSSGATLHGRERARTRDASRAVLILRGAGQVIVSAETQIEVQDPVFGADEKLDRLQLRLEVGSLRAEAAADAEVALDLLVGDQTVTVEPGGKVLVSLNPEKDQVLISFLDAAGFLTGPGGKRTRVPADHGVVVPVVASAAPAAPASQALPAPPSLAPGQDESITIYTAEEAAALARFRFRKADAELRLVVARDPGLTDIVADIRGLEGSVSPPTLPAGRYYWAVATLASDGLTGTFSPVRDLRIVEGDAPVTTDEEPSTAVRLSDRTSGSVFFSKRVPAIGIDWPGATSPRPYTFELSRSAKFKKPVVKTDTPESRYTARGLGPGRYFWRARSAEGALSTGNFLVRRVEGAVPKSVQKLNRVDESYAATRIVFEREPPALEFKWKPDARADGGYRLLVSREKKFRKPVVKRAASEGKARIKAGALPEGTFFWRAERLRADGSVFYPGRVRKLSIRFDNDVPTLEIATPAQGDLITADRVEVRGLAPRGTLLRVNGRRIQVDGRGRFSTRVKVNIGNPQLVFETQRGERRAFYVRTLRSTLR